MSESLQPLAHVEIKEEWDPEVKSQSEEKSDVFDSQEIFEKSVDIEENLDSSVHEEKKDFICLTCGKGFTKNTSLKKHKCVHDGLEYTCITCGKVFHHEEYLKRHYATVHEGKRDFICLNCGKCFKSRFKHCKYCLINIAGGNKDQLDVHGGYGTEH